MSILKSLKPTISLKENIQLNVICKLTRLKVEILYLFQMEFHIPINLDQKVEKCWLSHQQG